MLLFNAGAEAVDFDLPPLSAPRVWRRKADTSYPSPDDIRPLGASEALDQQEHYAMGPESSAVLVATS